MRGRCCLAIWIILVLLLVQSGEAAHHFPDYPVRPAGEYGNKVVQGGVIVAVEPVEDLTQQKTYFNSHLTSRGILAVFLVIQNTSATDSYLFDRTAVGLTEIGPDSKDMRRTAALRTSGGLVDLSLINDVTDVRDNLLKKELRSKTLAPGSSMSGFIYVPVPKDGQRQSIHLQVPLTNSQSGEIEVVNLLF